MRIALSCACVLSVVAVGLVAPVGAIPARAEENPLGTTVILNKWYDGITKAARYRIPALTQATNGDLLAFYDMRPNMDDLPANIGVVMRRSKDGGHTWGPVQTVRYEAGRAGNGDPSVLVDRETGRIFVFYAGSVTAGFSGASASNTEGDPSTMQVLYSYSDDNGSTWRHKNITQEAKDSSWGGIFAASGEGIQLRSEQYKGRLVQQYVVNASGTKVVSLYSDDHGENWQFGTPSTVAADENKAVELSDGRLMMSGRVSGAGGMRMVAFSDDGGATWGGRQLDGQQIDPTSNGTILRVYPDAALDDPKAKMLMLLNSEDPNIRRNVSAKISCDNGATWPGRLTIDPDEAEYVTGTPIFDASGQATGKVGVLYERAGYVEIAYTSVDTTKMNTLCAPISAKNAGQETSAANRGTFTAGARVQYRVDITNQTGAQIPAGTLAITGTDGVWTQVDTAQVPAIEAGASSRVAVPITIPTSVAGNRMLKATYTADGKTSQQYLFLTVTAARGARANPQVKIEPYLDAIYNDKNGDSGYSPVGDNAVVWARVTNTGNVPITNTQVSANSSFTNIAACKWSGAIPAGESRMCAGNLSSALLRHVFTQQEVNSGSWQPTFTVSANSSAGQVRHTSNRLRVDFDTTSPDLSGISGTDAAGAKVYVPTGDFQSSSYLRMPTEQVNSWLLPDGHDLGLEMAKDNRTSAQLVVNSPMPGQLSAEVSDAPGVTWEISYPSEIKNGNNGALTGGSTIDPLRTAAPQIEAGKNQSVWFVAHVAPDAPTGIIEQIITLKLDGEVIGSYPVRTSVRDVQLLAHDKRPFILDLWWHPDAIADWYGDDLWSDEHFEHMKPYLRELADAQQDVINIVINDDPWKLENGHPQTNSHYKPAVEWSFDGTDYSFDFTVFDKLVTAHEEAGINGPIHLFSMVNFRQLDRLTYLDIRTGQLADKRVNVGDADYNKAWGQFLNALKAHLDEKGWFDRTSLMFDEQSEAIMNRVHAILEEIAPQWQGELAAAADAVDEVDLTPYSAISYQIINSVPDSLIRERREAGEQTLLYTWAQPLKPNLITPSPLMSARNLSWIVGKKDLDGFLRWTFNSWPEDVYSNPTFMYTQGDEYVVYPGGTKDSPEAGPVSAMRWEVFQDGIDDAEIIREAKRTIGVDMDEVNRVIAGVGDTNTDSAPHWGAMVGARSILLNMIGEQEDDDPTMTASAESTMVVPGSPVKITVKVKAPISADLDPLTVTPQLPPGWQITPAPGSTGPIRAGQTGVLEFWVANNYGSGDATIRFTADAGGDQLSAEVGLNAAVNACVRAGLDGHNYGANSEEPTQGLPNEGPVRLAFDGQTSTHWHSAWNGHAYPIEAWWKTDAVAGQEICSVQYQQRQSGTNGNASAANIYTSPDGVSWTKVASVNPRDTRDVQSFDLPAGTTGPWVKFSITAATSTVTGSNFGSAAEFAAMKRVGATPGITITDEVAADGTATRTYEIPDNSISYVVNGEAKAPGTYTAQPGEQISVAMNGLAEHGYVLPEGAVPDWEHTFLAPSVNGNDASVEPGSQLPAGMRLTLAGNGGAVTYALSAGAPDWLNLAEDGTLTGTVPEDAELGAITVPFTVTEVVSDDANLPAVPGTFSARGQILINVVDPAADAPAALDPSVGADEIPAEVGKASTSAAVGFVMEADGTSAQKPEGTVFVLAPDAPAQAQIDPGTGVVTFTPSEDQYGQKVSVKVLVTYPQEYVESDPSDEFTLIFAVAARPAAPDAVIADVANVAASVGNAIADIALSVENGEITSVSGLPAGLQWAEGKISGTPTAAGTFTVTVSARNADGKVSTMTFNIVVEQRPVVDPENPGSSGDPEQPVDPVQPGDPEEPEQPEQPVDPETPGSSDDPEAPAPEQPEAPAPGEPSSGGSGAGTSILKPEKPAVAGNLDADPSLARSGSTTATLVGLAVLLMLVGAGFAASGKRGQRC